jgi:hypothetical protein
MGQYTRISLPLPCRLAHRSVGGGPNERAQPHRFHIIQKRFVWMLTSNTLAILTDCARKALCCGLGHHKANYSFFELPIRLVRNNRHV